MEKIIVAGFILLLLIGSSLFYWFQIRPAEIRNYCDGVAFADVSNINSKVGREKYDWKYMQCLHSKGLK